MSLTIINAVIDPSGSSYVLRITYDPTTVMYPDDVSGDITYFDEQGHSGSSPFAGAGERVTDTVIYAGFTGTNFPHTLTYTYVNEVGGSSVTNTVNIMAAAIPLPPQPPPILGSTLLISAVRDLTNSIMVVAKDPIPQTARYKIIDINGIPYSNAQKFDVQLDSNKNSWVTVFGYNNSDPYLTSPIYLKDVSSGVRTPEIPMYDMKTPQVINATASGNTLDVTVSFDPSPYTFFNKNSVYNAANCYIASETSGVAIYGMGTTTPTSPGQQMLTFSITGATPASDILANMYYVVLDYTVDMNGSAIPLFGPPALGITGGSVPVILEGVGVSLTATSDTTATAMITNIDKISEGSAPITSYELSLFVNGQFASKSTSSSSSFNVSGLTRGKTYQWQLICRNSVGYSDLFPAAPSNSYTVQMPNGGGGGGGTVVCFFGDAPVLTPDGYRRIDSLRKGDLVQTADGRAVPIQMVMHQRVAASSDTNPYVIERGQFGAKRRLLISPEHRVAVAGRGMIEARDLGLAQEDCTGVLDYYNLELPSWKHDTMVVAGVEVESLAPLRFAVITHDEFRALVKRQYGAMTPAIQAKILETCKFLSGGRVRVPVIHHQQ